MLQNLDTDSWHLAKQKLNKHSWWNSSRQHLCSMVVPFSFPLRLPWLAGSVGHSRPRPHGWGAVLIGCRVEAVDCLDVTHVFDSVVSGVSGSSRDLLLPCPFLLVSACGKRWSQRASCGTLIDAKRLTSAYDVPAGDRSRNPKRGRQKYQLCFVIAWNADISYIKHISFIVFPMMKSLQSSWVYDLGFNVHRWKMNDNTVTMPPV